MDKTHIKLLERLSLRQSTLPNRMVLAPMCQYSAKDGVAGDWHLVHLGKFALGGFGLVMTEATAVEERGRITHGDLGLWSDRHIAGLRRVTDFIHAEGALAAIQLAHAGRKASTQRPWEGHGPLTDVDQLRGDPSWPVVGPTNAAFAEGWSKPSALTPPEISEIVKAFGDAAARANVAGFDVLEIHGGHGYLLASFLSPAVNDRTDGYGESLEGRMRFPLEVTEAVRAHWPQEKPLFFRLSVVDGVSNGWSVEDSVALARELVRRGVDVVDCSSGGIRESGTLSNTKRGLGYQVGYAAEIRRKAGVKTMAVGLILDGPQAEAVLEAESADLIAIGREALFDPFWAHHAVQSLGGKTRTFDNWRPQAGWWLEKRENALAAIR
jgi:2,4-dienoyl-CoA reductase-like NADH-dependent reductase (Old Yellow Enzyme family)